MQKQFQQQLSNARFGKAPELKFAQPITDIPTNVMLWDAVAPRGLDPIQFIYGAKPTVEANLDGSQLNWFRQGTISGSPKVVAEFLLRRKVESDSTPRDQVLYSLYTSMWSDKMTAKTAQLTATGVHYNLWASPHGMGVSFGGFQQNMPKLMKTVLGSFQEGLAHDAVRFERIRKQMEDSLTDRSDMPVMFAFTDRQTLLTTRSSNAPEELLEALNTITVADVAALTPLKDGVQMSSLIMGNINQAEALGLAMEFDTILQPKVNVPMKEIDLYTPVAKFAKPVEVRRMNPRKNDPNHVTLITYTYGVPTVPERVNFGLLGILLGPASYDELRTNQQLGYVVSGGVSMVSNVVSLSVVVQGTVKTPDDTEPQIQMVLTDIMRKRLAHMDEATFMMMKMSYAKSMMEPPLGIGDEVGHWSELMQMGGQCGDRQLSALEYLATGLTKQSLIDAYEKLITPDTEDGMRNKVVVKLFGSNFKAVPARKSLAATRKELKGLNVPDADIELLAREYQNTVVLDKADSSIRQDLLKAEDATTFPTFVICENTKNDVQEMWKGAAQNIQKLFQPPSIVGGGDKLVGSQKEHSLLELEAKMPKFLDLSFSPMKTIERIKEASKWKSTRKIKTLPMKGDAANTHK